MEPWVGLEIVLLAPCSGLHRRDITAVVDLGVGLFAEAVVLLVGTLVAGQMLSALVGLAGRSPLRNCSSSTSRHQVSGCATRRSG